VQSRRAGVDVLALVQIGCVFDDALSNTFQKLGMSLAINRAAMGS